MAERGKALEVIRRAREAGMGSVRPGGEEVPIDGVVESTKTGEVFAHRHVLRNTGKAFKRPAGQWKLPDTAQTNEVRY